MPSMIETKIALNEKSYEILKATTKVGSKFTDWTFALRRKNLDRRWALQTERFNRKIERIAKEHDDQPVNYALTDAGVATISRSLNDTANLFVVDNNGECTSHELSR